jgi:hypothetical protein
VPRHDHSRPTSGTRSRCALRCPSSQRTLPPLTLLLSDACGGARSALLSYGVLRCCIQFVAIHSAHSHLLSAFHSGVTVIESAWSSCLPVAVRVAVVRGAAAIPVDPPHTVSTPAADMHPAATLVAIGNASMAAAQPYTIDGVRMIADVHAAANMMRTEIETQSGIDNVSGISQSEIADGMETESERANGNASIDRRHITHHITRRTPRRHHPLTLRLRLRPVQRSECQRLPQR